MTENAATLDRKPPFEVVFSQNVKVRYGYKDAHVELEANVLFIKFKRAFDPDEFLKGRDAFDKAKMWAQVPDYHRKTMLPEKPWLIDLGESVRIRYGFQDARVELEVDIVRNPITKEMKRFTHAFTEAEVMSAQEAFQKAYEWSKRPADEREREGASA